MLLLVNVCTSISKRMSKDLFSHATYTLIKQNFHSNTKYKIYPLKKKSIAWV